MIFLPANKIDARAEFSQRLMGIEVRMLVDAPASAELNNSVSMAFKEGNRLNLIFSDWEGHSEISRFSRSSQFGRPFPLSKELMEVLIFSQKLADQSTGAFDVTLGSLSRLWRIARHQKRLPDKAKIQQALKRSGHEKLLINEANSSARLTARGMVLDLGGVAKGYIADQM
ncbi:MAG: FAD:protein FMN transferase, partial [Opitutae bacterium]